jgi:hypothetical protein
MKKIDNICNYSAIKFKALEYMYSMLFSSYMAVESPSASPFLIIILAMPVYQLRCTPKVLAGFQE